MKKNILFGLISLAIMILLVGCSNNSLGDAVNVPSLPEDIPIYPDAIAKSGSEFGSITNVQYNVNAEPQEVLDWYKTNMPSVWQADDFDFLGSLSEGKIAQPSWQTEDFSPNPNARAGRKVIITIGEEDGLTSFGIMLTDYSQ